MMISPFSEIVDLIVMMSRGITSHIIPNPVIADIIFSPEILGIIIATGVGIASNFLFDLIKQMLIKRGGNKKTHITEIKKPDGTTLLVVDIDEDMTPEDANKIAKRITDAAEQLDKPEADEASPNENNLH